MNGLYHFADVDADERLTAYSKDLNPQVVDIKSFDFLIL